MNSYSIFHSPQSQLPESIKDTKSLLEELKNINLALSESLSHQQENTLKSKKSLLINDLEKRLAFLDSVNAVPSLIQEKYEDILPVLADEDNMWALYELAQYHDPTYQYHKYNQIPNPSYALSKYKRIVQLYDTRYSPDDSLPKKLVDIIYDAKAKTKDIQLYDAAVNQIADYCDRLSQQNQALTHEIESLRAQNAILNDLHAQIIVQGVRIESVEEKLDKIQRSETNFKLPQKRK